MEQCGSHKALQTELWFILLSASRGPWMGCFRGSGILGNLTRCSLSLGLGGVWTHETQALEEGVRRRIQALWGSWPCWGLTATDETVWCNPAGLQMFIGTGSSSEMGGCGLFPHHPLPHQVDKPRSLLRTQDQHSRTTSSLRACRSAHRGNIGHWPQQNSL